MIKYILVYHLKHAVCLCVQITMYTYNLLKFVLVYLLSFFEGCRED